jgi:nitroreductase
MMEGTMNFNEPVERLIQIRRSCRTYLKKGIDPAAFRELTEACKMFTTGLAGERLRFDIVELSGPGVERLDPYDFSLIINPMTFITGVIQISPRAYESCGYAMEHLVLKAVDLHLGTCWLGYFNPALFSNTRLNADEIFPAVCVVGYAAELPGEPDRKRWEKIFFDGDFYTPISREAAGNYRKSLEMLRLAPSSGNTQPWRIVKERNRDTFHFFKKCVVSHYEAKKLHNIDMGIAMCHFELVSRKNGIRGRWEEVNPLIYPVPRKVEYIISWIGER